MRNECPLNTKKSWHFSSRSYYNKISQGEECLNLVFYIILLLQINYFNNENHQKQILPLKLKHTSICEVKTRKARGKGEKTKLNLPQRAPARPSKVTCHVKESPRLFSDSRSSGDTGKTHFHKSSTRARWWPTNAGPVIYSTCHLYKNPNSLLFKTLPSYKKHILIHFCWITSSLWFQRMYHWISDYLKALEYRDDK